MKTTLIITCTKCGNPLLATNDQKTRTCPYCNKRIDVKKAKHITSAKNPYEASKILKNIKKQKRFNHQTEL
jgi:DNA-directed RNA polymerase subunit RPC12/RpoP